MTRRILGILLVVSPVVALSAPERLGFDPVTNVEAVASAYLAPENMVIYRMRQPDGSYREFEHDFEHPDRFYGPGKWRGKAKDDRITISSGPDEKGQRTRFVFKKGRLVTFVHDGKKSRFPYAKERDVPAGGPPYHFGEEWYDKSRLEANRKSARAIRRIFTNKWKRSGRLAWPYRNPNMNGCLYASLAILSVFFAMLPRKSFRIAGAALFAAFTAATLATGSRGALVALFAGLGLVALLNFKKILRSRMMLLGILLGSLCVGAWVVFHHGGRMLKRGFGEDAWSNQVRLEMWQASPQMMVEAPDGWDFTHIGRSYMDWYQRLEVVSLPGSLMNDHITRMVGIGWTGRCLYVFAWFAAFAILLSVALAKGSAVGAGACVFFAVAAWFNPVSMSFILWIPPVATALATLLYRSRAAFRPRRLVCALAAAAAMTGIVVSAVYFIGSIKPSRGYALYARDGKVCLKSPNPKYWVVDDGKALGGVLACKEMRGWYEKYPDAPPVGYVRDVKDLPATGIERLLLAGDACGKWMDMIVNKIKGGARLSLPDTVVFVSPPFPPSALPNGFVESCNVKVVVGEFAAKYEPEYENPPPWVVVVRGMELYIPGWMAIAVGDGHVEDDTETDDETDEFDE